MTNRLCSHKTYKDHAVGRTTSGQLIWQCAACGKSAQWGEAWSFFGILECRRCGMAEVDAVVCSEDCRRALAQKNVRFAKGQNEIRKRVSLARRSTQAGRIKFPR